jgi:hypothetical protein
MFHRLQEEDEKANREATERKLTGAEDGQGQRVADPSVLAGEDYSGAGSTPPASRTWVQYFIQVIMNKLDRSVLFLGLLSWIMNLVTPLVTNILKTLFPLSIRTPPATKFNIMDFIMNLQSSESSPPLLLRIVCLC